MRIDRLTSYKCRSENVLIAKSLLPFEDICNNSCQLRFISGVLNICRFRNTNRGKSLLEGSMMPQLAGIFLGSIWEFMRVWKDFRVTYVIPFVVGDEPSAADNPTLCTDGRPVSSSLPGKGSFVIETNHYISFTYLPLSARLHGAHVFELTSTSLSNVHTCCSQKPYRSFMQRQFQMLIYIYLEKRICFGSQYQQVTYTLIVVGHQHLRQQYIFQIFKQTNTITDFFGVR